MRTTIRDSRGACACELERRDKLHRQTCCPAAPSRRGKSALGYQSGKRSPHGGSGSAESQRGTLATLSKSPSPRRTCDEQRWRRTRRRLNVAIVSARVSTVHNGELISSSTHPGFEWRAGILIEGSGASFFRLPDIAGHRRRVGHFQGGGQIGGYDANRAKSKHWSGS